MIGNMATSICLVIWFCLSSLVDAFPSTYKLLTVSNMTEFHLNYPSSADYPTAMYYAVEYSTALLTTDSDDGASVFHFTPSNAIEKSRISSSLTDLGGSSIAGYSAGSPDNTSFTHISSITLQDGIYMLIAEASCVRKIRFNSAEDPADRIGDCEESGFNNTQTGVDMRLQDIKDIILDPDNQLYVLCGSDGPGDGGLMVVNMSGDDSRILALHDDIALSDEYSEGSPDVKDMTIDSSFSMLYIIVNDGGLVAYDISDIPETGYLTPHYRISTESGDPGANFTMDGVIHDNASMVVRPYDRQLLIQNYGNEVATKNSLVAIDLDVIETLDTGNSVPKYAISTLCSGGEEFTPLSSSACVVNALFSDPYKPVMDVDNDTGSLMMSIAGPNNNVSFFIYELTENETDFVETTTESTTSTTMPTTSTTMSTTTTPMTTTATTTTTIPTSTPGSTTTAAATSTPGSTTTAATTSTLGSTTTAAATSTPGSTTTAATSTPGSTTTAATTSTPGSTTTAAATSTMVSDEASNATTAYTKPDQNEVRTQTDPTPIVPAEYMCLYCDSECRQQNMTEMKNCTDGCYSGSLQVTNATKKYTTVVKGCAEDVSASSDEMECSEITREGSCRYYKIDDVKVEVCVRCCTNSMCNDWMKHEDHTPNGSSPISVNSWSILICLLTFITLKSLAGD